MGQERLQFRVPEDEADILEEYAEENDLSKSEVLRRGMRLYLAEQGYEVPVADGLGRDREEMLDRKLDEMSAELETELKTELEEIEQARRSTNRASTLAIVGGLVWIGATLGLNLDGVLWLVSGVALTVLVVASTILVRYFDRVAERIEE